MAANLVEGSDSEGASDEHTWTLDIDQRTWVWIPVYCMYESWCISGTRPTYFCHAMVQWCGDTIILHEAGRLSLNMNTWDELLPYVEILVTADSLPVEQGCARREHREMVRISASQFEIISANSLRIRVNLTCGGDAYLAMTAVFASEYRQLDAELNV
mmetsp:Transcript_2718/g.4217  ORF Transcript_2718/g.4217 Transcript_2718/m.4217 type:complete len:158 (-) Transcript_2718:56-529(-)|eukprot:CAMPEP_0174996542 /NCGR_PEP_ID=MMETSP0005-20121125/453_1 /TAXON_ID=420556 /ORGANISM="Ochromonas sp., Strain CCMP1393" /LENGTH=157 /DNA_ID=CAMNT_0016250963 /DNA_START=182 /DNA_END=655 /DNA_ORIENTATION=+